MFSTDKNIETISQPLQLARHYLGLQGEYLKLDITEKAVRLITALLLFIIFMLLFIAILTYLSFAAAYALGSVVGNTWAFCIVAGAYMLLFVLLVVFKKRWIERPLVRFIAGLLME